MTYSTIYDLDGNTLTDGVQSQRACDATINTARAMARSRGRRQAGERKQRVAFERGSFFIGEHEACGLCRDRFCGKGFRAEERDGR